MRRTLPIMVSALAAATLFAGCGADKPRPHPETAETLAYGSAGRNTQIDCGAGKSLDISGSNNSLTVLGACWSVQISGADNRIRLDRVDGDLSVTGVNNTVDYRDGDPTVRDEGSGNRITGG